MSKPENWQNEQQSNSNPWIKNERRAESEPGKKERVPSYAFNKIKILLVATIALEKSLKIPTLILMKQSLLVHMGQSTP